ncbi:MAG: serine/threonine protein kinase, partial [Acidobacteria bacterium]|nr:serine/threonine protein kinase [Acidobacteriota bacterium]
AGMESESIERRLKAERQILASLDHPYIARLYDGGSTADGRPYFVLEYIDGVPLDEFCEQNQLSVDERLTLFGKVCEAVHYAHQNLVVHRDLKPSNILVTAEGEPRLLDFGIAKLLNPDLHGTGLEPTATWHRLLTPNYASPEQVRGKLVTTATDVYSLGVLLYKILCGRLPHQLTGLSVHEIESVLSEAEPLPPSRVVAEPAADGDETEARPREPEASAGGGAALRRQLSGDLDAIVLKALRSAPQHRYGSVEQMAADVRRFQEGRPVVARAGSWRYRAGKFLGRNRRGLALAAALVLAAASFVVALALQAARVAYQRDQARLERDLKSQVLLLVQEIFEQSNPFVVPGQELTVREALERTVPLLQGSLGDQPAVRAELLHTSGTLLGILGSHDLAREELEEALELRRGDEEEMGPGLALSLASLAGVYRDQGDLEKAECLAREAVERSRDL